MPHYWDNFYYGDVRKAVGKRFLGEWLELDRTLVHLWESFSIRPNVRWRMGSEKSVVAEHVGCLLPEMARRGMVTYY